MNIHRTYNWTVTILIIVCVFILASLLTGCSVTSVNRGPEGELTVTHRTFLIKTEAPSLEVERDDVNDYVAKFNAKSRGGDIEAMAQILEMFIAAKALPQLPNGDTP